jgi:iron complex outermembrane receptor protein
MRTVISTIRPILIRTTSAAVLATALFSASAAFAQTTPEQTEDDAPASQEIIVTGSRIERAGFDAPSPTTVIGEVELRQGQRTNLQQVLNDSPQFRPTTTPQVSVGNTSSGSAPVDLRGLGAGRTLTLINGRRFVGNNNLNYIPLNLVDRVEVVTGGASAAYGSDAIAGVVNLVLKNSVKGVNIGVQSGISSRGDGHRYGADITAGTSFADGHGQIMFGGEYVNDKSIKDRNSRPNLGSTGVVRVNPTNPADRRQQLVRDVNYGNQVSSGLIISGVLAGQMFNEDGTLRTYGRGISLAENPATTPFPSQVIGGADAVGLYDAIVVTTPLERISTFGRISYDFGGVSVWADVAYGRSKSKYAFLPNIGQPTSYTIQASNPFVNSTIRTALAAAGQTSFTLGKFLDGPFMPIYSGTRTQKEGAVGIDADLGGSWKARAHFSHGEIEFAQRISNTLITPKFNNAINAVSAGGQTVCAINADAITTNDDAACRPLNLLGRYGASAESLAYVMGTQQNDTTTKLDSVAAEIQGDLFSLWSTPITIVFGAEARFEEQISVSGALDRTPLTFGAIQLYGAPVSGGFNVKEGFGEIALPVFDIEGTAKLDLNGAARYSDYSRSGGIWSWKGGGTLELFDSLLLRATRSRDIRAPTVGELFTVQSIGIGPLVDQDTAGRTTVGYNSNPQAVRTLAGGNINLVPEISHTTTLGATFSPKFFPGFNLSVDYYDVSIAGAISTLSGSNLTAACRNGSDAACARITRDATGTVIEVRSNSQNIAKFETSGLDFEASYVMPMSSLSDSIPGTLRIRALATYVKKFVFDTGVVPIDSAGDVGVGTGNAIPKWRGLLGISYQNETIGLDARIRYVDGGKFNHLLEKEYVESITIPGSPASTAYLINNDVGSRTYVDLGIQFKVSDQFTLSGNVNNVFDVKPPLSPVGPVYHDAVGRYFTASARVKF